MLNANFYELASATDRGEKAFAFSPRHPRDWVDGSVDAHGVHELPTTVAQLDTILAARPQGNHSI